MLIKVKALADDKNSVARLDLAHLHNISTTTTSTKHINSKDNTFVTHKESAPRTSQRPTKSTSAIYCASERKLNDLTFAEDVALLENSEERAHKQFDARKTQQNVDYV